VCPGPVPYVPRPFSYVPVRFRVSRSGSLCPGPVPCVPGPVPCVPVPVPVPSGASRFWREVEVQRSPEEQQVSGWFSGSDEN